MKTMKTKMKMIKPCAAGGSRSLTLKFLLAVAISAASYGCGGMPVLGPAASSGVFAISPAAPQALKNSALQFTALLNGTPVGAPVQWSSSDPAVATIDGQGKATLLRIGTSKITVSTVALQGLQASTVLSVTTATAPVFRTQPADTNVSAVIGAGAGVRVQLLDNLGGPLAGQSIAVSIGVNPPGTGTLSGTLVETTDATGAAAFPDLKIDWLGNGYTLIAAAQPSSGSVSGTSAPFNEVRVGDPCLGPNPACSSGCPNASGDGLNDAWKIAGGIDLNGDGKIDAQHDLPLPAADANMQDLYVQYDWMDYSTPGNACSTAADCGKYGAAHGDEACTGPQVLPTAPASCVFACSTDADCTSRFLSVNRVGDKCISQVCQHTHDPDVIAPAALPSVVKSFADHGINLHLLRGHALLHSLVVSFRQNSAMTDVCEGGSVASGTAGTGKYAESFYDLKASSSLDKRKIAYHYAIFGHYSGCDSPADCARCPAATNPDGSPKNAPVWGETGLAEISGNDFIVSLGGFFQDLNRRPQVFNVGSTFMHELGHNLGLRHGGGVDTPCATNADCTGGVSCTSTPIGNYCLAGEDINAKPNFLSVMNYRYQFTGIQASRVAGSSVPDPSLTRLDFSTQVLPAGGNTPGLLDQSTAPNSPAVGDPGLGLSEPAGLGSGVADIFTFTSSRETGIPSTAASNGPVDWDQDNDLTKLHVQADTNCGPSGFGDHPCNAPQYPLLRGHADWGFAGGNQFTYKFQCTPFGGPTGDGAAASGRMLQSELSGQTAMAMHVAEPIGRAEIIVRPGCSTKAIAPGPHGTVQVAVLGSPDLDVNEIDASSLRFHGARALSVSVVNVNHDGIAGLLLEFPLLDMHLSPRASRARITGWLKNGQAFVGEDDVRVVQNMAGEDASCR
jgi:hypothetical protein